MANDEVAITADNLGEELLRLEGSSSLFDAIPENFARIYPPLVELTDEQAGDTMDWVLQEYRRKFPSQYQAFIIQMQEFRSLHKRTPFGNLACKTSVSGDALQNWVMEIPTPIANFLRRVLGINWIREPRYLRLFKSKFKEGLLTHRSKA